jgi:hypothetical protein
MMGADRHDRDGYGWRILLAILILVPLLSCVACIASGYFFVERQTAAWLSQPTSPPGRSCWSGPNQFGPLKDLESDPAAALVMPGADRLPPDGPLYQGAAERSCGFTHSQPAELQMIFGTQASFAEVVDFYGRTLVGTGWANQPSIIPAPLSPATAARGTATRSPMPASPTGARWCKTGMTLSVVPVTIQASGTPAAWDGFPHDPALLGGRTYATVYGIGLRGADPAAPCPVPAATAVPIRP